MGIDIARIIAIFLALLSHAFGRVGLVFTSAAELAMRASTPLFLVLFGCMITIVYIPRYNKISFGYFTRICWMRAGECYLWFLFNLFLLFLTGSQSLLYTIRSAFFMGSTAYVQILTLYTVYFLALPWLIAALQKVGLVRALAFAFLVHLAFVPIKALQISDRVPGFAYIQRIIDLAIGAGTQNMIAGPSILHSLALVLGGVWVGRLIVDVLQTNRGLARLIAPFLAFAVVAAWSVTENSIVAVTGKTLSDLTLRNLNHPAYTMIYGALAVFVIPVLVLGLRSFKPREAALVVGKRSLFVFGFGNAIISCWANYYGSVILQTLSAIMLLGTVIAVVYAYDILLVRRFSSRPLDFLALIVQKMTRSIKDYLSIASDIIVRRYL
ncbi:hypothetical protein [Sphingomonas paeninsulae]|nr:hypothetical protein [Sphingomonas paeninsulae]